MLFFGLHPLGSLWVKFGNRIVYDTALGMDAKVSNIIHNNSRNWPCVSSWEVKELIDHTPSDVIPTSGNDQIIWAPSPDGKFSINSTWNFLRKSFPKIGWARLLWGPHNIPKASFVTWMVILGRLNTGDRLQMFGTDHPTDCVFCHDPIENHPHLFFECPFSCRVWECIKGRLNVDWPNNPWPEIIDHVLRSAGGKTLRATISRLAFTCIVYHLWLARNNRIFSKELTSEEVVIKCIVDMVRFRMMSITNLIKHSSDSWFLSSWRLPHTIITTAAPGMRVGSSVNVG